MHFLKALSTESLRNVILQGYYEFIKQEHELDDNSLNAVNKQKKWPFEEKIGV